MNYLIHQDTLDELDDIIGNQGSPATSKVSDSFAALEVAIKTGTKKEAQAAFDAAVQANILVGKAWEHAQHWHDKVENENQTEDGASGQGGTQPGAPAIPANAIEMFDAGGGNLKTQDGKDVTIQGKNYAAHVKAGKGATGPVYHFKANYSAAMASMSCDGRKIAFSVTDAPADPGEPYNGNTASATGYKAGQYCNFRIGEGGYTDDTTAIFSIT